MGSKSKNAHRKHYAFLRDVAATKREEQEREAIRMLLGANFWDNSNKRFVKRENYSPPRTRFFDRDGNEITDVIEYERGTWRQPQTVQTDEGSLTIDDIRRVLGYA